MKNRIGSLFIGLYLFTICPYNIFAQETLQEAFTLSTADGIQLAGEIEYPNKAGKFPTAILIWGNGPHTRDVEISGSPTFKQMATALCAQDMAVVRIDKRGFGKSTGIFTSEGNYTTQDLVNDFKVVYAFINNHPSVDTSKVGLIGTSEGSIISYALAAEEPGLDWVIVYGPAAVAGDRIVAEQQALQRKKLGMEAATSDAVGNVWTKLSQFIKDGAANDSAYYAIGRELLIAHGMDEDDERITHAFIDQLLDAYRTPWSVHFFQHDPAEDLKKMEIPFLALFGGKDEQTTVELNLIPMHQALSQANNQKYRILVLADEDHFFVRYQDKRMVKHSFGEMEISSRMLTSIKDWLRAEGIIE